MLARVRRFLPIAWLMALLLVPATAYLVGARQPELENRAKTPFPDLNRGTLRKEHTFQQIDAAIRERLPTRRYAIDLRGRIAIDLFGDSPSRDVVLGKDRWLYYRPSLRVCEPDGRPEVSPANAVGFVTRAISASGRTPVVIVTPSKMVTHRAHLKGVDPEALDCATAIAESIQERLAEVPGGYPIQPRLAELEADGIATFLRSDTHWNARGREVFARLVLDAVRPGLADEAGLRRVGETERPGDLGMMIGQERIDRDEMLTVTGRPETSYAPGELLFVGDSQFEAAMRTPGADGSTVLDRVFPGQPVCNWTQMSQDGCAAAMLAAKTIVIQSVGRNMDVFADTCWRTVSTLTETVRGIPARWADTGRTARRTVSPHATTVRVELDEDRTDVPRLIRLPVRRLPADPAADPANPPQVVALPSEARACARTTAGEGSGLVIPVRTGERVSDVTLRISGPVGTELGRPEILVLDSEPLPTRSPAR